MFAIQRHGEQTAGLHRLQRVRTEIHRDLVQLRGVPDDCRAAGVESLFEPYAGCERGSGKQLESFLDNGLDVDRTKLAHAAAAESEYTIHQRLGAPAGVHHVVDEPAHVAAFGYRLLCKLTVPEDCAENIVEVVSDAARECSHGLHLLRLAKLGFEAVLLRLGPLAFCHVHDGAHSLNHRARRVKNRMADTMDMLNRSVRENYPIVDFILGLNNAEFVKQVLVVGMEGLPQGVAGDFGIGVKAKYSPQLW